MAFDITVIEAQQILCAKFGAVFSPLPSNIKVGIALNVKEGLKPLNGLRHPPEGDTSGWYIWAGEILSDDPGFFVPLHAEHLVDWCPQALKFLGLPPGRRFLADGKYEDVWEDKSLLKIHGHNYSQK
jgi:hypothetical protein